jgi:SAM-dependent methyltransferase
MSDLSQSWAESIMATEQRIVVDRELAQMQEGIIRPLFRVAADILIELRGRNSLKNVTLLDIGCGSAYYYDVIGYFLPGWVQYTGVDFNPSMIELARKHHPALSLLQADTRDLSQFEDRAFDVVLSGAVLMTIREWLPALKEQARVTARWLILHRTPLYWDDELTSIGKTTAYGNQVWDVRFNKQQLVSILSELGFELLSVRSSDNTTDPQRGQTLLFERVD